MDSVNGVPKIINCLNTDSLNTKGLYCAIILTVSDKLSKGIKNEENSRKILARDIDANVAVSSETKIYPIAIPIIIKIDEIISTATMIYMTLANIETPNASCAIVSKINACTATTTRFVIKMLIKNE